MRFASPRFMLMLIAIVSLAGMIAIASGCETSSSRVANTSDDPVGTTPHDLTIDVSILLGRGVDDYPEAHRRPLRIVLYPDGSLHSGVHPQRGYVNWVPGLTRRLNRDQMSELYALARQLNLSDLERSDELVNPALVEPQRNEIVHMHTMTANDRRWMFLRRHRPDEEFDPAVTRFIRKLAGLAWETDLPLDQPIVMPKRYDFGPDPYAQYRGTR